MTLQQWFAKPGSWCQHAAARTASGRRVLSRSRAAVCLCVSGALDRFYRQEDDKQKGAARLLAVIRANYYWDETVISRWNDDPGRTIDEVRRLVKRAKV